MRRCGRAAASHPGIPRTVRAGLRRRECGQRENLGKAIAAFERSLVATTRRSIATCAANRGDDAAPDRGHARFERIGCAKCHSGPMFSDFKVHVLGVPDNGKLADSDAGWPAATPSARPRSGISTFTAPYMHNGTLATLDDVVEFYDDVQNGGRRGTPGHAIRTSRAGSRSPRP